MAVAKKGVRRGRGLPRLWDRRQQQRQKDEEPNVIPLRNRHQETSPTERVRLLLLLALKLELLPRSGLPSDPRRAQITNRPITKPWKAGSRTGTVRTGHQPESSRRAALGSSVRPLARARNHRWPSRRAQEAVAIVVPWRPWKSAASEPEKARLRTVTVPSYLPKGPVWQLDVGRIEYASGID